MNSLVFKALTIAAIFVVIFVLGFWLSRSGRPYSPALFNVHKLLALALLAWVIFGVVRARQPGPLEPLAMVALAATVLLFAATIVSGGVLNLEGGVPEVVARVHHVLPYLTVVSTAICIYLLA